MAKIIKASDLRRMESALRKARKDYRTVMRLARLARDEADAMAKKGVKIDEKELRRFIFHPARLLDARTNAGVRSVVRSLGTIEVGNGITVNYEQYMTAKRYISNFNKSVRGYNLYHKAEIEAGTLQARKEKKWTLGAKPEETQDSANRWIENVLFSYQSASDYEMRARLEYYNHLITGLKRMTPIGMDYIIDFFKDRLLPIIKSWTGEWWSVGWVYDPEDFYHNVLVPLARHYGIYKEFMELRDRHRDDFREQFAV